MDIRIIRSELDRISQGNEEYAIFHSNIVKTNKKVLGARTPDLRKLAKRLAKDTSYKELLTLLNNLDSSIYEEVVLAGMVINHAKLTDQKKLNLTEKYLKLVDNWAHIDLFVEKKRGQYDKELWWRYSIKCLNSTNEFTVRFGVINLMSNYLDDEHIEQVLVRLRAVSHDGYYVKMGLAWLYATAAISYFNRVTKELSEPETNPWVRNKAYQKMLESYRINNEQKITIRELKKI